MAEESTGLQGAASRIRETAKWVTVSLAAIGAVLVAGLQLTNIGQLDASSTRFWLAIFGGIIAAIGAGVVLIAASRVMTGSSVSLQSITKKPPAGTAEVVKDPTLLNGYEDVAALNTEYLTAVRVRNEAQTHYLNDPTNAALRTQAEAADARAVVVSNTTQELLRVVSYEHLAHSWRVAAPWIMAGGVLAGAGIGLYAWSANPPPDAAASVATPNIVTAPTAKKLTLTSDGIDSLKEALGEDCDTTKPINVLVLATTGAGPDVLTNQDASCKRVRFILGPDWGTLTG